MVTWDDVKLPLLKKILFIIVFVSIVVYFHLSLWQICALLIAYTLIKGVIKGGLKLGKFIISSAVMVAFIYGISYAYKYMQAWGVLAAIIGVSVITAAYIIIVQWKKYIEGMQQIEREIWGSTAEERKSKNIKK